MHISILLLLSAITLGNTQQCIFKIDGEYYSRTNILNIIGLPTNLAYNNHTGDLFFTLIDIESLLNDEIETKMDVYVHNDNGTTKISNINGQTAVVDTSKGLVFFGSDSGIYVFDEVTKEAVPIGLTTDDIVQLYVSPISDELYAVLYPSAEIYIISNGGKTKKRIEEISSASIVAVDRNENIYFQSDSKGLSVLLKGFKEPISYVGFKTDAGRVLTAVADRILAATTDGLYELRSDNVIPKKVGDFDYVPTGFAVHGHDIYSATSGTIFKYTKRGCYS